ncbi:helix-turn-helix domain-containing protein [Flavobacterium sp. LAR06]|uniref:helix-turn-helix domain-containing protein n=1 Tax=Flavobacterium sp. LAR06 TaxID=3064897 RepID=UPI0035C16109
MNTATKPKHIGRNISRIRELRGMKQEALAIAIGVSQQSISNIEASETIDEERLSAIAKILGVTPSAITNFSEESVINYFNNFYDNSSSQGNSFNQGMFATFNPLDKLIEAYEENKKLYERLVQAEKDKVEYLENLLKAK